MSYLETLKYKLPKELSKEDIDIFKQYFSNTESLESLGTENKQGTFIFNKDKLSLESWDDNLYKLNGHEVSLPQGVLDFKEWIDNKDYDSFFNSEGRRTLHFNPALDGGTLKSVIGDKYKGLDCEFMVPIMVHKETRSQRIGPVITIYTVNIVGIIYLGEGPKHGKIAFFTLADNTTEREIWNGLVLKDAWKFLKWFQPDFKTDPTKLKSNFMTIFEHIFSIAKKIKDFFKSDD